MASETKRLFTKTRTLALLALALGLSFLFHRHAYQLPTNLISRYTSNAPYLLQRSEEIYQRHVAARNAYMVKYGALADDFNPWKLTNDYMIWWWYFQPAFNCPHEVERVGKFSDGGKWICGLSVYEAAASRKPCVIYTFVSSTYAFSFEKAMIERAGCQVWAYVPKLEDLSEDVRSNPNIHLKAAQLSTTDRTNFEKKIFLTLPTALRDNGHDWIDVLHMDLEGNEYRLMDTVMDSYPEGVLPFSQLLTELHLRKSVDDQVAFKDFRAWYNRMEAYGMRPYWAELNGVPEVLANMGIKFSKYSFLNIAGDHRLLH